MITTTLRVSSTIVLGACLAAAQSPTPAAQSPNAAAGTSAVGLVAVPPGYVIGAQDVLSIVFWRDKDMSAEVVVRPDGKISLPLLNDVQAVGYTPEQLRVALVAAASKFLEEPNATVVVKEIHSRNVFITGNVAKPASYPLTGELTVLHLIAMAGGLLEYSDSGNISIIRNEGGRTEYFKFNYKDVIKRKNVRQNIVLKPGDTVVVP